MIGRVVAGIFVGGASTRMGGQPKGLLPVPDGRAIVDRLRAVLEEAGAGEVVLVGRHPAYAAAPVDALDDTPPGIGPLGGLIALLARAQGGHAIAVACDMPYVSCRLVARLLAAPEAVAVAPRHERRWEPLCARYEADAVRPLAEAQSRGPDHSLQRLLDRAGAIELPLSEAETRELRDWDRPDDVGRC
ncbi:MAG: molybdenum cofactor guanylyltransferase [Polyangiaceae bacterium]|nr:molybdenum cofactor guanylyltransferase [Polyangiaceae bacterium]